VSSESSCALRLARHSQNAWARHVECVESSRVEPSGIWAYAVLSRVVSVSSVWLFPLHLKTILSQQYFWC